MIQSPHRMAVVTGATSGIGAAFAAELAARNYDLILTGRRVDKINAVASGLRSRHGVKVQVEILDLADEPALDAFVARLESTAIDLLVNNAGFGHKALFPQGDLALLEKMVSVHVSAPMRLTHAVLPGMIQRGSGGVIQVSSAAALLPHEKNAVYSATKAFLKTFSEALAIDLAGTGVKVQALCPSFTGLHESDFHERMGVPQPFQKRTGLISWWMTGAQVARKSLEDLEAGRVVCIPARNVRVLSRVFALLPQSAYRWWASRVFAPDYRASLALGQAGDGAEGKGSGH